MILPERVLGKPSAKRISSGRARGADLLDDVLHQLLFQVLVGRIATFKGDEAADCLSLEIVRLADHGGLGHLLMADQRAFNFHRAQAVPGNVDDVINAAHDPEIAVLVAAGTVTGEVLAFDLAPVLGLKALVVTINGPNHARPGLSDHQQAANVGRQRAAVTVDDLRDNADERLRGRAGNGWRGAGEGRDHDGAGLGLPPGIDDRATLATDLAVVPHPGFGVDRLTDSAQQPQRGQIALAGPFHAPFHERTDGGGGCCRGC